MAKKKYIETPDALLSLWDEYKQTIDGNPEIEEVVTVKGEIVKKTIKKPYLRMGFEAFVYRKHKITIHQYIDNDGGKYPEYLGVVTCMRKEWEEDQITGTMTGRYKAPNLTARLNGITDKVETKNEHKVEALKIEVVNTGVLPASSEKDIKL